MIGAAALLTPGCSPSTYTVFKTEAVNNTIQVPLQLFENSTLQIVRPKGWQYDIAVQKKPDNSFQSLPNPMPGDEAKVIGNKFSMNILVPESKMFPLA